MGQLSQQGTRPRQGKDLNFIIQFFHRSRTLEGLVVVHRLSSCSCHAVPTTIWLSVYYLPYIQDLFIVKRASSICSHPFHILCMYIYFLHVLSTRYRREHVLLRPPRHALLFCAHTFYCSLLVTIMATSASFHGVVGLQNGSSLVPHYYGNLCFTSRDKTDSSPHKKLEILRVNVFTSGDTKTVSFATRVCNYI
jgi:hypothetical protein